MPWRVVILIFDFLDIPFYMGSEDVRFYEELFDGFEQILNDIEFIMSHFLRHDQFAGTTTRGMEFLGMAEGD